ncbi:F0F1 ATP synthase subunit A [Terrisporobacter sp.]|uniref:F0F1 ATP synthase subunit A n=1 Tax=Terrisporobacter sp. TaxID=1965305 RepID=UPI0026300B3B|nr:F0F1 ATP synthase subunit A [Terrisporobacter sp.]
MRDIQWIIEFANGFKISETVVTSWIIMAVIIIAAKLLTRNLKPVPTSKSQIMLEYAVVTLRNLIRANMGQNVEKKMPNMVPYIGSLFVFFVCSNLVGLLGFRSPTADVDTTLAWALVTCFLIYYQGMKSNGLRYWKGLLEPVPLLLPLNIIGEFARPISLTFRPFGNILGGTVIMGLIYKFLGYVSTLIPNISIPFLQFVIPVPLHFYFDLFAGVLQAFIFIMLTMVFVSDAAGE